MITVHHLTNSRSQRILWLLEELALPYEIVRYERDPNTMLAPPELRAVHPLGKSPVVTDQGQTLAESGAILDYLVETYGNSRLIPAVGAPERQRYRMWMHYAEGSAMPVLSMKLILSRLPNTSGAIAHFIDPQIAQHADYWETELSQSEWFAGDAFTVADIQMSFPVEAAAVRGDGKERPKTATYLNRIRERPAYLAAVARGGPYTLMR